MSKRRTTGTVGWAFLAAVALGLLGMAGAGAVRPVFAAQPTTQPFVEGRHVYDNGNLFSPNALARADALAARIEAAGGGRVVVYTNAPDESTNASDLAAAWGVDGMLLTGDDDFGEVVLGDTLKAHLSTEAAKYLGGESSGFEPMAGWTTSMLARADALLRGKHVFDGPGVLDAAHLQAAEAKVVGLGQKIGGTVYVDIAASADNAESTAFFNNMSSDFKKSLVIAIGVSDVQIGGYIDADSDLWDTYQTGSPWVYDMLLNETAPGGDVQAAVMQAIDAVGTPPNPVEAAASAVDWVRDSVTSFFSNRTNVLASLIGLLVALGSLIAFRLDRRRRRREGGFADDDSVLLPAPPAEMTPALASIVAAPLNSTRAITVALLDLAAHGRIAFYQGSDPWGSGGSIRILGGSGSEAPTRGRRRTAGAAGLASSRALGPAEDSLLEALRSQAGIAGGSLSFGDLRPLFEQTVEQLEQTARQRGWLNLQSRSVSAFWMAAGAALLVAAGASVYLVQPVAALCLGLAGLIVLPGSRWMPLPLRTPNGVMTTAMVEAYRRTLRKALAGDRAEMPPWLASAEEAALWGYAWGLEGEVQAFVAGNVGQAMMGPASSTARSGAPLVLFLAGLSGSRAGSPIGLDTDAIGAAVGNLSRGLIGSGDGPGDGGTEISGRT